MQIREKKSPTYSMDIQQEKGHMMQQPKNN